MRRVYETGTTPNWDSNVLPTAIRHRDRDGAYVVAEPSFSGHITLPSPSRWHPKLTGYRALVLTLTVGFGSSKAFLTYHGKSIAPITLEWVFGVVLLLVIFWLGLYESYNPQEMPILFQKDFAPSAWRVLALCHYHVPPYRTDERPIATSIKRLHPPLTGYRIMVSVLVTIFGLTKAILSYRGLSTVPTTLDWVFGVVVTTSLYWLGLYETSPIDTFPTLFRKDYGPFVMVILIPAFRGGFIIGYLFLHVLAMCLGAGWSYLWFIGLLAAWPMEKKEPSANAPPRPTSTLHTASHLSMKFLCSVIACVAVGMGVITCIVALASFVRALIPLVKLVAAYLRRWIRAGDSDSKQSPSFALPKLGLTYLQSTVKYVAMQTSKILEGLTLVLLALGYIFAHAVGMLLCLAWTSIQLSAFVRLWEQTPTMNIFMVMFIWPLNFASCLFWLVLGVVAFFALVVSLVAPIFGQQPVFDMEGSFSALPLLVEWALTSRYGE